MAGAGKAGAEGAEAKAPCKPELKEEWKNEGLTQQGQVINEEQEEPVTDPAASKGSSKGPAEPDTQQPGVEGEEGKVTLSQGPTHSFLGSDLAALGAKDPAALVAQVRVGHFAYKACQA